MAAASTDKFKLASNGSRPSPTTLTALKSIGASSITVGALTGWPTTTGVDFCIYTIDTSGNKVAGSQTDWSGTASGTTISNLTLRAGTDNGYAVGAIVEAGPVAAWADDIVSGINVEHDQDGTHGAITPTSIVSSGAITGTVGTFNSVVISGASTSQGWTALGATPNTITANSSVPKVFDLVFNTTDLTGTLSNGMKLQLARTVAAPSQCTDLELASSQYYSKTSPSGLSFTTTFSCSAWIKLESYGTQMGIIARRNASTEGFSMALNSSGQLLLAALRVASNNKVGTSYASVPLNKWVHVAATMDVTVAGNASTNMYFDGILVDSSVTTTGTCTALVQGTTALVVGAEQSDGTNKFDGKIAQAAVYSAVLSASTIRDSINRTLSGSETNLVSAYSFNNSITDLNANANNLTANNSAVATNADSPFANAVTAGSLEYAEVLNVAFSTNTTVTVRVPAGCQLPTSGGVSSVLYSTQSNPYGLPAFSNVIGYAQIMSNFTTTSVSATQVLGLTAPVYIPSGRNVAIDVYYYKTGNNTANVASDLGIWDGVVASGTLLNMATFTQPGGVTTQSYTINIQAQTIASGAKTYNASCLVSGGTQTIVATAITPGFIRVRLI